MPVEPSYGRKRVKIKSQEAVDLSEGELAKALIMATS